MQKYLQQLSLLYDKGEAQALLRMLVEDLCHESWTRFVAYGAVSDERLLEGAVARLAAGEPVQHILGYADFCGHRFHVTPATLIPRPETEDLVNWIVEETQKLKNSKTQKLKNSKTQKLKNSKTQKLLDIGTGSGCIAVSLALVLPDTEVTALDINAEALAVARSNDSSGHVRFLCHDILSPAPPDLAQQDVIVSNPPYICNCERAAMHVNVLDHEPHTALFVPDDDPLLFYRAIAVHGQSLLRSGGLLFFEVNRAYASATATLLEGMGYAEIEVRDDRFGNPRMVKAKKL